MKNDFVIQREFRQDGILYLFVDMKKTIFRGINWSQLGDWGKRKAENLLFLMKTNETKNQIKIKYV